MHTYRAAGQSWTVRPGENHDKAWAAAMAAAIANQSERPNGHV